MTDNLATLVSPPPSLSGSHLDAVRAGCAQVEHRCPGIKCWIDRARQLVVFGPARLEGLSLFAYAVPLFKNTGGRLHPMGFVGADSVDRVVDKLNSAKMPEHQKIALERQAEKDLEHARVNALEKVIEDRRPEAEKFQRWIRSNLSTDFKFRRFMGLAH